MQSTETAQVTLDQSAFNRLERDHPQLLAILAGHLHAGRTPRQIYTLALDGGNRSEMASLMWGAAEHLVKHPELL